MSIRNFRIILQYDGTKYQGWQKQVSTENTIQGKLETLLTKMCEEVVEVNGAGRTDAGVHAFGQVANFHIETDKTAEEIMQYMNQYLPQDISVISCKEAGERFHARLNATGKHYQYSIWNSPKKPVFNRNYTHQVPEQLDMDAITEAISYLVGTHDFQSFTSTKRGKKSTVRTIDAIDIERKGEELIFHFRGNGFLYHMVRILMGTLVEVGLGIRKAEDIPGVIEACDRSKAGHLIPAKGLTLVEVTYD